MSKKIIASRSENPIKHQPKFNSSYKPSYCDLLPSSIHMKLSLCLFLKPNHDCSSRFHVIFIGYFWAHVQSTHVCYSTMVLLQLLDTRRAHEASLRVPAVTLHIRARSLQANALMLRLPLSSRHSQKRQKKRNLNKAEKSQSGKSGLPDLTSAPSKSFQFSFN